MSGITLGAIYFIVWWLTFFAMLPVGLKTQEEDGDVTLGTVPSAPRGPHVLRAAIATTVVSAIICGGVYGLMVWFDLSLDSIPKIIPDA